jgi:peptide/nickel transport system substrate-binding protein
MSRQFRASRRSRLLLGAGGAALVVAVAVAGAAAVAPARSAGTPLALSNSQAHKCLVMAGSGDPAFVKNFNPYTATGLPSGTVVKGAIYEGLIVTPAGGLKPVPWLARSWKWSNGNKTLTLNLATNAKWSDGTPLTSADVVYSLKGGNGAQAKVMDILGSTRPDSNIASITAKGKYAVVITLKTVDSQFLSTTLNGAFIVPEHIWAKVKDPATFTNPHPVGSGPFDQIARFTSQDYVFGKNPHYWQAGKPLIPCLEYVQASSNDAALALIQSGQVDWTHNFVANVEKAYEAKDPAHYHAFYATTAYPQSLVFDDTQYPYSLVAFRKALSQAIDRNSISKLGEYGYAPATSALGIEFLFPQWVTDPSVKAQAKALATYNPAAAKKTLTDAGFTYKGNQLLDPKGNPVSLDIHVISGWSDWVASDQIIAKNLQAIGISSKEVLEPDWNSWYPNAASTKNPTLLWQVGGQGSPYGFFNANLSNNAFVASGLDATNTGNWEHFKSDQGTALLQQWKQSLDPAKQHAAATALEKLFLQQLPIVPLFVGPRWSTYSTKYFHCFDSPQDHFGDPIFTTFPDNLLSFTRICPGGKDGQ